MTLIQPLSDDIIEEYIAKHKSFAALVIINN